jgi:hypothetical protein
MDLFHVYVKKTYELTLAKPQENEQMDNYLWRITAGIWKRDAYE